jgi:cephalosporin hydroxylase
MEINEIQEIVSNNRASQNASELTALLYEVEQIMPKVIVEIGVHKGYSLEVWKKAWPEAEVIGIDIDTKELDMKAVEGCKIIQGDSHLDKIEKRLQKLLKGRLIDFLFIDGDHMYEGVRRDFEMYAPTVAQGGIVAFHDAYIVDNPGVEVHRFWEQAATLARNTITVGQGGTGTGILYL